jgi:thymidine kinase
MHKNYKRTGSLEVICGPMFSGKSEELIRRLRRAQIAQQRVIVFKHAIDDRYNATCVTSHNGATIDAHATHDHATILDIVQKEDYAVVGIDEIQFYESSIIATVCALLKHKVRVIVAGLDLDHRGIPFGPTPILLALADSVSKLCAICTLCGSDAHFSQRIHTTPSLANSPHEIIQVGGTESYVARCRDCYETDIPLNDQHYYQAQL